MPKTLDVCPLRVGFFVNWQPYERVLAEQACPPGMTCCFIQGNPLADQEALATLDVLVVGTQEVSSALIEAAPRLRLIQRWGTGLDNIDTAGTEKRGIATAELPGINARSVSEFIVCAILTLLRHLPDVTAAWAEGRWLSSAERAPSHRLEGKTVGLLGFGAIGRDVARLLEGFAVQIIYHDVAAITSSGSRIRAVPKDELLKASDIVTVQLPLTPTTKNFLGEAEIASMKKSAVLVCVSRAGIVNEAAVRQAVREGRLFAASFDNFDPEPLPRENIKREPRVLATPHMAGSTVEGFQALLASCFASIEKYRNQMVEGNNASIGSGQ